MTEDILFDELFARLPTNPEEIVVAPGDDCAAIKWHNDKLMLLAIDQIAGNRHYISSGKNATSAKLAGRKLLARNLSDIAAMGGKALFCLLGTAFKKGKEKCWINDFYDGIISLAKEHSVFMIGGDYISTENDDVAGLTIIGEVPANEIILRSGAKPGDLLCVTGACGKSFETEHHLNFQPRCQEGRWLAKNNFAAAMIDISDGLLLDASRICKHSNCGLKIFTEKIPLRNQNTSIKEALHDGEDFELLFAVNESKIDQLLASWCFENTPLSVIGKFTENKSIIDTNDQPLIPVGWDHLRN
jgi:thiamine-monophosphate kinase